MLQPLHIGGLKSEASASILPARRGGGNGLWKVLFEEHMFKGFYTAK